LWLNLNRPLGRQPSRTPTPTTTSWYGASIGGDLGLQATTTDTTTTTTLTLADPLGSVASTIVVPSTGQHVQLDAVSTWDEYGNPLAATTTAGGAIQLGWYGAKERATNPTTGLVLMGARLYNRVTGLFTSVDPVPGGNTTAYTYPQDPINKLDLDGQRSWWSKNWKWVAAGALILGVAAVCIFATAARDAAVSAGVRIGARLVAPVVRGARVVRSVHGHWSSENTVIGVRYVSQRYGSTRYIKLDRPDKVRPYYHIVRGKISGKAKKHVALNHLRVSPNIIPKE
jgi:RHS repeat-associated protein